MAYSRRRRADGGYTSLNREPLFERTFATRGFQAIYAKPQLAALAERNQCPQNDRLCTEAVWLTQTMLLGPRGDMDQIVEAIRKIQTHAAPLART